MQDSRDGKGNVTPAQLIVKRATRQHLRGPPTCAPRVSETDLFTVQQFRMVGKTNPRAPWRERPGRHRQRNFTAEAEGAAVYRIYLRQNLDDDQDFSCGLALVQKGGKPPSLVRCNGASHAHGEIRYRCHIHRATAEAMSAGRKVDGHADATDRYRTLEGALACLIEVCAVQGLTAQHDEPDLFDGP